MKLVKTNNKDLMKWVGAEVVQVPASEGYVQFSAPKLCCYCVTSIASAHMEGCRYTVYTVSGFTLEFMLEQGECVSYMPCGNVGVNRVDMLRAV